MRLFNPYERNHNIWEHHFWASIGLANISIKLQYIANNILTFYFLYDNIANYIIINNIFTGILHHRSQWEVREPAAFQEPYHCIHSVHKW
jgi:hypothetical protein